MSFLLRKHRSNAMLILFGMIVVAASLKPVQAGSPSIDLILPPSPSLPVLFGAEELADALEEKGFSVNQLTSDATSTGQLAILVGRYHDAAVEDVVRELDGVGRGRLSSAEAFVIHRLEGQLRPTVAVVGSDDAGAMYGTLDLAEQIEMMDSQAEFPERVEEKAKAPFLALRGENLFLTREAFRDPNSWFFSEDYWRSYLDMLARARWNFLDLHGGYGVSRTDFPNLLPYLVWLDRYAAVNQACGVSAEQAEASVGMLRRIIKMAKGRGVKVGLMNYTGSADGAIPDDELAAYTREAVAKLLRELPGLWAVGFRVGESGRPTDFYREAYLRGIEDSGKTPRLVVRSWLVRKRDVLAIAGDYDGETYVEIKYNSEHLGLPYQAAGNRQAHWFSGWYQDYVVEPRNYRVVWQVRASGTHRIFHWGNPTFIKRTVMSAEFGDGVGFSLEPPHTFYPKTDYFHNDAAVQHDYFTWVPARYWYWYLFWGRVGYDPETPQAVWIHAFSKRFGSAAGPKVYRALTEASKILPLVSTVHAPSPPDHRGSAPELETGGTLDSFIKTLTLDDCNVESVLEYVENRLTGKVSTKRSPLAVGRLVGQAAGRSLRLAADAEVLLRADQVSPAAEKEFECIRMDIEALAHLGRYHQEKKAAAVALALFRASHDYWQLRAARSHMMRAIGAWHSLATVTGRHYRPFPEMLRMRTTEFHWTAEETKLAADLSLLDREEQAFRAAMTQEPTRVAIGHIPVRRIRPGFGVPVRASIATRSRIRHARVLFKAHRARTWRAIDLKKQGDFLYRAVLPTQRLRRGRLHYYLDVQAGRRMVRLPARAPRIAFPVIVAGDTERPRIGRPTTNLNRTAMRLKVSVQVKDASPIASVKVVYKPVPSQLTPSTVRFIDRVTRGERSGLADFIRFHINKPATVYVVHEESAPVPFWMDDLGFARTAQTLVMAEGSQRFELWRKEYPAGRVVLGSNFVPYGWMYTVVVSPKQEEGFRLSGLSPLYLELDSANVGTRFYVDWYRPNRVLQIPHELKGKPWIRTSTEQATKVWVSKGMRSVGGRFEAVVPVAEEGILLYIGAVDAAGNGTIYPDFLQRTPYLWIR